MIFPPMQLISLGDWNPLDSIPNVFFSLEEAEEALKELKEATDDR